MSFSENDASYGVSCPLDKEKQNTKKEIGFAPIFLIGMRASGKTTLGQALAQRLNRVFVDTDHYICAHAGTDVAGIVANEGWDGFREKEAHALRHVAQPDAVIATGGGMVLRPENRDFMRQAGICVYLEASADELWRRLKQNPQEGQRPPLLGAARQPSPCLSDMQNLLAEREQMYRQAAHHVLSVQGKPDDIVAALLALCCPYVEDRKK